MQKEKYKSWIDSYNDKFKENVARFYGEENSECSLYPKLEKYRGIKYEPYTVDKNEYNSLLYSVLQDGKKVNWNYKRNTNCITKKLKRLYSYFCL
jgi:hypothetical protein